MIPVVFRGSRAVVDLAAVLKRHGFGVVEQKQGQARISRGDGSAVRLRVDGGTMSFSVPLGIIPQKADRAFFISLLKMTHDILPACFTVEETPQGAQLILALSRVSASLSEDDLLEVLDTMEVATDRVSYVLREHLTEREKSRRMRQMT